MSRIKKIPFKPGEYIVNTRETLSDRPVEERARYAQYLYDGPSDWWYVERLQLYKLEKLEKDVYWVNNPVFPVVLTVEKRTWAELQTFDHYKDNIFKFKAETYEKLAKLNPVKFNLEDKILNPFLKYTNESINKWEADSDFDDVTIYHEDDRDKDHRCKWAKSLPFLYVKTIEPMVYFNFKYEKFLFKLDYKYTCRADTADDAIQISIMTCEQKQLQPYTTVNSIWNTICMSPNPET